ncbi:paraquat-inducible protein B [Pseudomonas nitritireducens]|uniref:Paraquat-inducible protein B n=1 Tax=Pseudomonas nitroreducens TaxID=46680 RepID=A0A7W7P2P6_PSENT|nr:MlaD family protein [Pseudomonas nitritireducens]MBB4864964.1 paraquat-inducible protein B [Pseudomonas nitritireducens]
MQRDTEDSKPGQAQVRTRRWNVSLVWIVPIVALAIGASLIVRSWMEKGPVIEISFRTGDGLVAHKTQVKYRAVVIGEVDTVELAPDKRGVIATVKLDKAAESFASEGAQFWVVRPRVGAGGISGVDTLLSGSFIGADAGESTRPARHFTGLEAPPPVTYGEKGKRFMLHADDLGSLDIGSTVYYRKIPVGQVITYNLRQDGKGVDIGVFIEAPNDAFVTANSRFWNASGIDLDLGANGLKVNTESLSSILMGGLAFGVPEGAPADDALAKDEQGFELFADRDTALAPPAGIAQKLRMRFDQSMRGLAVGAPVEFMGVAFGKVTSVKLDYDPKTLSFPVMVEAVVYPQRLGPVRDRMLAISNTQAGDEEAAANLIAAFVKHGLRAQARSGNLLTGQLFVSLDFYPDAKPVQFDVAARPFVIPTVPGSLDKLQEQLQEVVERIRKLPLERIANNLDGNLSELQKSLKQFNGQTLPNVTRTLDEVSATLKTANAALGENSPQREKLSDTLDELDRMSRSLRDLSDYLGRHPESLIRGRPKNADADNLRP